MASWGPKLYQDDIAEDVRNYFKDQLKRGKSNEEVTNALIEGYQDVISDIDDAPIFWFALANTQWELGRLLTIVNENALKWLSEGSNLRRWEEDEPKEAITRKKVLEELKQKLNSPMPPEKKISKYKLYKCEWKIGDVFAYKLDSDYAKERGIYERYFLFQKVDETICHPGHIIPIARVKITKDEVLPKKEEEFNELEYVQTAFTKYEDRFLPFNMQRSMEEQLAEKSKIKFEVDEYGFLPEYRLRLFNTSKRIIPKKLIYIGNFPNILPPSKEFIPHSEMNIVAFVWKFFDKIMIDRYCGYNLKQYAIYSSENKQKSSEKEN